MNTNRFAPWLLTAAVALGSIAAQAQAIKPPDALIKEVSSDVLDTVKADNSIRAGDVQKVIALVDSKVRPYVDFQRMTASAVGRYWKQATPEQQKRLQDEFKILLVRTYSGALSKAKDQTVQLKLMRSTPEDTEVVVRSEVRGKGDPIQPTTGPRRRHRAGRSTTQRPRCMAGGNDRIALPRRSAPTASMA